MSYGKMNTLITIQELVTQKDAEAFTHQTESIVARVRAYKEEKHGSIKWANMAAFTNADALFTFRVIPTIEIKSGMIVVCDTQRYNIVSTEVLKGRYTKVLAQKIEPVKG